MVEGESFSNSMAEQEKLVESLTLSLKKCNYELEFYTEYLSNLFETIPMMLFAIYSNGLINTWNKEAARLSGISEEEAYGKVFWDVLPCLSSFKSKYQDVINGRMIKKFPPEHYEIEINGSKIIYILEISLLPLFSRDNPGMVFIVSDQTDKHKIEEQLQQIQKMETVGTLAGGLVHDFNNALSGVVGTVSLMKYKVQKHGQLDRDMLLSYISIVEESSNRAVEMVQQLLSLSHKQELSLTLSDLNNSVRHIQKICQNTFDKSIEIKTSFAASPAHCCCDAGKIEQVLLNLCVNASHAMTFMRNGVRGRQNILTISMEEVLADNSFCMSHPEAVLNSKYLVVSVGDTGIGMAPKTVAKIFEPFFTTKENGKGTGLGLSMASHIVKQHSGFIDVYSEVGFGSVFSVYLPSTPEKQLASSQISHENIYSGSGQILVIDDEPVMRETARFILEECGYSILLAVNGKEAINLYRENMQDIKAVIMDIYMPKMNGIETLPELLKMNSAVKVLLASGFNKDAEVQKLLDMGAKGFLKKPFTIGRMSKALSEIMEHSESDLEKR